MIRGIKNRQIITLLVVSLLISGIANFTLGSFNDLDRIRSERVKGATSENPAPSTPSNLKAEFTTDKNTVLLVWSISDSSTAITGYEIERKLKETADWRKIGEALTLSFNDFEFAPKQVYEYRVRASATGENFSEYSNVAEATTGDFLANVTMQNGGVIADTEGRISVNFPSAATAEDVAVFVEKLPLKNSTVFQLPKNTRLAENGYRIRVKNAKGEGISDLKKQVNLSFSLKNLKNITPKKLQIGSLNEDKTTAILASYYNPEKNTVVTLSNHLSTYFLITPKSNPWLSVIKIIFWVLLIAAAGYGIYVLWQKYSLAQYRKEHKEDYIYKH